MRIFHFELSNPRSLSVLILDVFDKKDSYT